MSNVFKVYVGNLPYSADDDSLRDFFSDCVEDANNDILSAKVIMDRDSGRSKGFGFVEFSNDSAMKQAIAKGEKEEFDGRPVRVNEAKPQDPDRSRSRR